MPACNDNLKARAMKLAHPGSTDFSMLAVFILAVSHTISGASASGAGVDWQSLKWIGGHNQLRAQFVITDKTGGPFVLSLTALGCYEAFVNGEKLGPGVLEPGFSTVPSKRLLYAEHDITSSLQLGDNVVGVRLGSCKYGWMHTYCSDSPANCVGLKLQLTAQNTGEQLLSTNASAADSWMGSQSEFAVDGPSYPERVLWDGVRYNYSLRQPGWSSPGFELSRMGPGRWTPVAFITPPIDPTIFTKRSMPAIVKSAPLPVVASWSPEPGITVVDFGNNMAGYATLHLPAQSNLQRGYVVTVLHGEILEGPGGLVQNQYAVPPHDAHDCAHYGSCAAQTDRYVMPASHEATLLEPSFTYHGYRYAQLNVSDAPTPISIQASQVQGHFLHTDVPVVGHFSSNSTVLNGIQSAIQQTVLSNLQSVPSDCPTREKRGWMGDAQWSAANNLMNFEMEDVYRNFVRTIGDTQLVGCTHANKANPPPDYCLNNPIDGAPFASSWAVPMRGAATARPPCYLCCDATVTNKQRFGCYSVAGAAGQNFTDVDGAVPGVVPFDNVAGWPADPAWGAAAVVIPHADWKHTGDLAAAANAYPIMSRYCDFLLRHVSPDGLVRFGMLGDWNAYKYDSTPETRDLIAPRTPVPQVSAFYGILCLSYAADVAAELGHNSDAKRYRERAASMKQAYYTAFYRNESGTYSPDAPGGNCSQTSNVLPVVLGIVRPAEKLRILAALNHSLYCYRGPTPEPALMAGCAGTRYLFEALVALGREDIALAIAMKQTKPSFGWMVKNGPGTLWEQWGGDMYHPGGDPSRGLVSSKNHHMYSGGIGLFLFENVAGISIEVTTALPGPVALLLSTPVSPMEFEQPRTVVIKPLLLIMQRVQAATASVRAPVHRGAARERSNVTVAWSFTPAVNASTSVQWEVRVSSGVSPLQVPIVVHVPLGGAHAGSALRATRVTLMPIATTATGANRPKVLWDAALASGNTVAGVRQSLDDAGRNELLVSLADMCNQDRQCNASSRPLEFVFVASANIIHASHPNHAQ